MTKKPSRGVAFVTGASRGLGRATSIELAANGFDLVLASRTVSAGDKHQHGLGKASEATALPGSLQETAQLARTYEVTVDVAPFDLRNVEQATQTVERVLNDFGKIDIFVNNAVYKGRGDFARIIDLEYGELTEMVKCNFLTPFSLFQHIVRHTLRHKHRDVVFINLATPSSRLEPKFSVDKGGWSFGYSSTKSAASKLIPLLAVEHPYEESGMRFYNVEPGLVVTEHMKKRGLADSLTKGFGNVPPEATAKVIAWLSTSPKSQEMLLKLNGRVIYAPKLCEDLQLLDSFKEKKPSKAESKL